MRLLESSYVPETRRVDSLPLAIFVGIAILVIVALAISLTLWRRDHFPLKSSGRSATLNTMCAMAALLLLWYPAMNAFEEPHNKRSCDVYFFIITSFVPLFALPLLIGYARYYWEWTTQSRLQKELARRFDKAARAANRSGGGGAPMPPVAESPQMPTNRKEFHAVATAEGKSVYGENARREVTRLRKRTSVRSCLMYVLAGYLPTVAISCCLYAFEPEAVKVLSKARCGLGLSTRIYEGAMIFATLVSIIKMHWRTRGHLREDTFGIRKEYRAMVGGGLCWLIAWGSVWVAYPEGRERFDPGYLQVGGALHVLVFLMIWPALRTFKYFQPEITTRPRSSNVTLQMPLGVLSKHLRGASGNSPGMGRRHSRAGSRTAAARRGSQGSSTDSGSMHSLSSSDGVAVRKANFSGSFSGAAAFSISHVRLKAESNASLAGSMLSGGRLSPTVGHHQRVLSGTSDGEDHARGMSIEMSSSVGSSRQGAPMLGALPDRDDGDMSADVNGSVSPGGSAGASDKIMGVVAANPIVPSPPPPPPDVMDVNVRGSDSAYDFSDANPGAPGNNVMLASSPSLELEELEDSRLPSDTLVMVDVNAIGRESQGEPSLEDLLQDRDGFMLFARHLQSEFASENLLFWQDCDDVLLRSFDGLPDSAMPLKRALDLMDLYITNDALHQVNLPGKQRDHIIGEVGTAREAAQSANLDPCTVSVPKVLFQEAQTEIFTIMRNDSFARFQFTDDWQRWLTGATHEDMKIVGSSPVATDDASQPGHPGNAAAATRPGTMAQLQHWWGRVRRRGRGESTKLLHMTTSDSL